jgi:branched-chain amino acid aminotransferase
MINLKKIYQGDIWYNGVFTPWQEVKLHVFTNSLHYSGAVFEGIRSYNGKAFKLNEHITRLLYSASVLGIDVEYTHKDLCKAVEDLLIKNNISNSYIRPLIWLGDDDLRVKSINNKVNVMIAAYNFDNSFDPNNQMSVLLSSWRKGSPLSIPHQAKTSGNYTTALAALTEIKNTQFQDVLFLDLDGFIAELVSSNIFFAKGNKLITPSAKSCLNGITKQTIIELASMHNFIVEERDITLDELVNFDECFSVGTAAEICSIKSINLDKTSYNSINFLNNKTTITIAKYYSELVRR